MDYPICSSQIVDDLVIITRGAVSLDLEETGYQIFYRSNMAYKWKSLEILLESESTNASWPDFVK